MKKETLPNENTIINQNYYDDYNIYNALFETINAKYIKLFNDVEEIKKDILILKNNLKNTENLTSHYTCYNELKKRLSKALNDSNKILSDFGFDDLKTVITDKNFDELNTNIVNLNNILKNKNLLNNAKITLNSILKNTVQKISEYYNQELNAIKTNDANTQKNIFTQYDDLLQKFTQKIQQLPNNVDKKSCIDNFTKKVKAKKTDEIKKRVDRLYNFWIEELKNIDNLPWLQIQRQSFLDRFQAIEHPNQWTQEGKTYAREKRSQFGKECDKKAGSIYYNKYKNSIAYKCGRNIQFFHRANKISIFYTHDLKINLTFLFLSMCVSGYLGYRYIPKLNSVLAPALIGVVAGAMLSIFIISIIAFLRTQDEITQVNEVLQHAKEEKNIEQNSNQSP